MRLWQRSKIIEPGEERGSVSMTILKRFSFVLE